MQLDPTLHGLRILLHAVRIVSLEGIWVVYLIAVDAAMKYAPSIALRLRVAGWGEWEADTPRCENPAEGESMS